MRDNPRGRIVPLFLASEIHAIGCSAFRTRAVEGRFEVNLRNFKSRVALGTDSLRFDSPHFMPVHKKDYEPNDGSDPKKDKRSCPGYKRDDAGAYRQKPEYAAGDSAFFKRIA